MELGRNFAQVIAQTSYESLPEEAVIAAKQAIMDTLGVTLAGSGVGEGVAETIDFAMGLGGTDDCTIIGTGKRSNAVVAAFANGAMAHAIDYDDVHDDAFIHPSSSVVPTALTVGELVGASGKDVITAVALGNDLSCRLGYAAANVPESNALLWMLPVMQGTYASTAAAAKLLGLSEDQTLAAFGLALHRAGGSEELLLEPGALRGLYAMFPNMTGVMSALMAKAGIPGLVEPFNGPGGMFNLCYAGKYDESAFDDMGVRFEGANVSIKPWPCCRFTNSSVNAALDMAVEHDIDPTQIEHITIFYENEKTERCLFPEEDRKNPPSIPGAKLSLPFTVALALAYRKIEMGSFDEQVLSDELVLGLCAKTSYERDESLVTDLSKVMLPARVRAEMQDGNVYEKRVDAVIGHPANRMTWTDLLAKFKDCASYARRTFSDGELDNISSVIEHFEDVADVKELLTLVC